MYNILFRHFVERTKNRASKNQIKFKTINIINYNVLINCTPITRKNEQ